MKGSNPQQGGQFRTYYQLTKPGIIYGNVMTGIAGFVFALSLPVSHYGRWQHDAMSWSDVAIRGGATIIGMALVIASACVANNYMDRGIDKAMARTSKRALVTGKVSLRAAVIYAATLGVLGFSLLLAFTPPIVAAVGAVAFVDYVLLYGWAKRHSVHSTLVGSISGAAPLVAGYVSISAGLDMYALLLFIIMAAWQMPHFYAIGIYRAKDYAAAKLPILPVTKGAGRTKFEIIAYMALYVCSTLALTVAIPHASYWFAIPAVGGALWWLVVALRRYPHAKDQGNAITAADEAWARKTFLQSLVVLLLLSAGLILQTIGPSIDL